MKTQELIKQAEELLGHLKHDYHFSVVGGDSCMRENPNTKFRCNRSVRWLVSNEGNMSDLRNTSSFFIFARNHMQEIIDKLKKYEEALVNVGGYYSHNNDIEAVFNIARKALEEE